MLLAKLFARRNSRSPSLSLGHERRSAKTRRLPRCSPHVESLEDRTLLSGWVVNAVGNLDDPGNDVAVDSAGNIYLTGNFTGTRDFDPGPATYSLTSAGTNDLFVAKYASDGSFIWATRAGSNPVICCGSKLAIDTAGNTYVTGSFQGTINIGSKTLTSAGGGDIYVAKLDSSGNFLWAVSAGGTSFDHGSGIAVDGTGNSYVAGGFETTVDFDPSPSTVFNMTSAGRRDIFVWKLSANGDFVWAVRAGSVEDPDHPETAISVALDSSGNVYSTGAFMNGADFDPGPGTYNLTGSGYRDVFVWKLDPNANLVWARAVGAPEGDDFGNGVAVDGGGNVYVAGYVQGTADLDPGPGIATFSSSGCLGGFSKDAFVLKLDANGNLAWATKTTGIGGEDPSYRGDPLALDGNADVYVVGVFDSSVVDFDTGPGAAMLANRRGTDGFIWKLSGTTGGFVWARSVGGTGYDDARGVAVDQTGNVYTVGEFSGTAVFDTGASDVSLTATGTSDVYLLKITQDSGSILGRVFNDSNNNGADDSTEIRLDGWTVYLDLNNNAVLDTGEPSTVSGAFGEYQFKHLSAGTYTVREIVQGGWTTTLPAGGTHVVTLGTGGFAERSFGNFNPAQSPAGWLPSPSGCQDQKTGLIWLPGGGSYPFWGAQDQAINAVQSGYDDYGEATLKQMQTAVTNGILTQGAIGGTRWSTTLASNNNAWAFDFYSATPVLGDAQLCGCRWLMFVRGPGVVHSDNGDANYSDTVTGWTTVTGQGRDGDYRIHASGNGSAKATWTFTAQPAGQYKVLATWVAASSNARNAPYKIFDGSTLLKTTTADQRKAPSSNQGGITIAWADLGTVTTTGGVIKVELNNNASGNVVADMVRLVPISPTGVAAMVTSRDVRQRGVDAAIASHYFDNDDRENNLTLLERLDRHTLRALLHARRLQ